MKKASRELLTLHDVRGSRTYSKRNVFLLKRARQVIADLLMSKLNEALVRDVKPTKIVPIMIWNSVKSIKAIQSTYVIW